MQCPDLSDGLRQVSAKSFLELLGHQLEINLATRYEDSDDGVIVRATETLSGEKTIVKVKIEISYSTCLTVRFDVL